MSSAYREQLKDPQLWHNQAYIDGQWVDGGASFEVDNPATGEIIAQVASVGRQQVEHAIDAAARAQKLWAAETAQHRGRVLRRWFELIMQHRDDLARLMTWEQGKVLAEAKGEIAYAASFVEWFAEEARRTYGDTIPLPQPGARGVVIKQPVGVVAAITPWNFPSAMITRKAGPALAVGCAIVIKPAPETPLSALALAELADRAGVPAGLFNVVPGEAEAIGRVLTESPVVRKITFTGSTRVGKLLLRQSADSVKKVSMELGGNAPVLVFDDADIEQAVKGAAASKYRNSGQTCICANRILVQSGVYDRFVERFKQELEGYRLGDGCDPASTHGPLITDQAAARVAQVVDQAVAAGAQLLVGGQPSSLGQRFYPPTLLTGVTEQMRVFSEEIFGPVAPVIRFDTEAQAIALANATEYGLAAYLYTRDIGRAWRLSEALEYGMVGVNETGITSDVVPFGGVKASGMGREGSKYGVDDYLETKYICMGGLDR